MHSFIELKKKGKEEINTPAYTAEITLLGDSPTQFFKTALTGYGVYSNIAYTVFDEDIDQIDMNILDIHSNLYQKNNNYIVVFHSVHKLQQKFYSDPNPSTFYQRYLEKIKQYCDNLFAHSNHKLILLNFPEISDAVFGNYQNKTPNSWIFQVRHINAGLQDIALNYPDLSIVDVCSEVSLLGISNCFSGAIYLQNGMVYHIDFTARITKHIHDIIRVRLGKVMKCLILDLDNTLWGGIIGDDGIENIQLGELGVGKCYTELQEWAIQLKNRGIILCVCSKNNEDVAKQPFIHHPDMRLRLNDIAVFVANWETKVDNIRHIQQILNIGFDAMVFLDDNPFEREMVKNAIPDINVPDLPEDPALYLSYIQQFNYFETASLVDSDKERTKQYQEESKRVLYQKSFTDESSFLEHLDMKAIVEPLTKFNIPRVAQLSQRSNQFNLRTSRCTEEDLARMSVDSNYIVCNFYLNDKFGSHGLIGVIMIKKNSETEWFIENWFMSCRVLKRGMEQFMMNTIVQAVKEKGASVLVGEFIPTPKNALVENHYNSLGFTFKNGLYYLDLKTYSVKECKITME